MGERHLNASWIHTWNNVYKVLQSNPEYLPNTYLQYYLLSKDVVEESNPEYTRANEVMDSREKDLFEGIDHYIKTGEVTAKAFYHGAHGNYIADLAMALKNDTKKKFIVIVQNNGAIAVSYTHLDVYKRQAEWSALQPYTAAYFQPMRETPNHETAYYNSSNLKNRESGTY